MTVLSGEAQLAGRVRTLRSVGAGNDGAVFVGVDEHGPCAVHRVRADVASDPARRRRLQRRLAFHGVGQQERVPGLLPVRFVDLDARPAVIVVGHSATSLADVGCLNGRASGDDVVAVVGHLAALARVLAVAHAEGVVHGALTPSAVRIVDDVAGPARSAPGPLGPRVGVAFLGLRTEQPSDELARALCPNLFVDDGEPHSSDDAWSFGGLLCLLTVGRGRALELLSNGPREAATAAMSAPMDQSEHPLMMLARDLLDSEPAWRPTLSDVSARLDHLHATLLGKTRGEAKTAASHTDVIEDADEDEVASVEPEPTRIGRFRFTGKLGAGAMGAVYRGVDEDSGAVVAVKLLKKEGVPSPKALRRFRKEARLLAELTTPGIARFIDAGDENGQLYLVTELVEGTNLNIVVKNRGAFPEREAVAIIIDLLRALADVHDCGIVHRDIKPENVVLLDGAPGGGSGTRVKLIDFGVARHEDESRSLAMTREGAVLGTPLYMAPEQARGGVVDARSDIYAVGTSLFQLLVGRAPFAGRGITATLAAQLEERPPPVSELQPGLSDEVSRVVARSLEKDPALRYQNAGEMLRALEALAAPVAQVERGPARPSSTSTQVWRFSWQLGATPAALWPYVSNTERLNRAIGLAAVDESVDVRGDDVVALGSTKQAGFQLSWKENPFEWVFERRLGVLREYSEGPLRWYRSTVELQPAAPGSGKGTELVHTIEVEPRGLLGRAASNVEVGVRVRRALERTYRRIDDLVQGRLGSRGVDAFEEPKPLSSTTEARFAVAERAAVAAGAEPAVVAALGDWLRHAAPQDLARIRPIALARRLALDETATLHACYAAAHAGLLVPLWDLLCPTCRTPTTMEETLRAIRDHAACEVCNIHFALDLAASIELVFRVHPSLRDADAATYCISSPAHTPHVMAQVRVERGASVAVDVALPEGGYQVSGRRLGFSASFRVRHGAPNRRWQLGLGHAPVDEGSVRAFATGRQEILLVNDSDRDQLVRIERTTPRDDVLTAARALASPVFKRLFPSEVLAPGALVRVAAVTLMLVEIRGRVVDDVSNTEEQAWNKLYLLYRAVEEAVVACSGTVVKLQGEGVLAVFDTPVQAVRCAVQVPKLIAKTSGAHVRCAVHRGPAGAVTLNEHLDYFGRVVHEILQLIARAKPGELLLSDEIRADVDVDVALAGVAGAAGSFDDVGHRVQLSETLHT